MPSDTASAATEQSTLTDAFSPDGEGYDGYADPARFEDIDSPWQDVEILHRLYWHEEMSYPAISDVLGCAHSTISNWFSRLEIPKRSRSETMAVVNDPDNHQRILFDHQGYMGWQNTDGFLYVHRLLAISEWGVDAVAGNLIHHKNGIPWDNRIENLKIVTPETHMNEHRKIRGTDRLAVAEKYEHGDISSRDLGDMYGVTQAPILEIHKEFYGCDNE